MPSDDKIETLTALAERSRYAREDGETVVHCHGVFDLLHIGHIRYLQKARELGDLLIVTVTPDRFVNKGPHRPAFPEQLRATALAALDCVDAIAINDSPTATEAIAALNPSIYAKGGEFRNQKTPELVREEKAVQAVGARIEFIDDITSSSSHLINNYLGLFPEDVERFLDEFKSRYTADEIFDVLERARALKVLIVGEAIIDEHYACNTLGRSMKAPIIAAQYQSHARYAGGALAVANHAAAFCDNVGLVAMLGSDDSQEDWVRGQVNASVEPTFAYKADSPTIVKRRYRESYFSIPLFEVNFLNEQPLNADDDESLCHILAERVGNYDAVVVADYGHSMLSDAARETICERAKFVAVSPQVNAANVGYQTIGKYSRADFVVLAQQELELECRKRGGSIQEMVQHVAETNAVETLAVTLGKRGCLCYNRESGFQESPALATKVVDRAGAGDAFFAVTSLCAALGLPLDLLAFLGNVAGAEAVSVVGNSEYLDQLPFSRHVQSLLK